MKLPGFNVVRQATQRLRDYLTPKVAILMYHRVIELRSDPPVLTVTPQHFGEHMEVVERLRCCISLSRLARMMRSGRLPRRAVVVTFDDGYADNLLHAKPLLERHGTPATVFVATGLLGQNREYWWDELDRLLLEPGTVPSSLNLRANGDTFAAELGPAASYSTEDYEEHRSWNVVREDYPTRRHEVYRALHKWIRPRPAQERQELLAALQHWAGRTADGRPSHRVMTPEEVVQLHRGGLVEIGAHTVTHPVLAAQPAAEQRAEVRQSKERLEEILGQPVETFAYPYGSEADFNEETVDAVRAAGFSCACATRSDIVRRKPDRFRLPRQMVLDMSGAEFEWQLRAWFES
jgi:peptidoglycan/xylan/chitin deacetylase (PgdA/CDA1 family)